jgi:3-phosphoshikimate 1-carboxyvinyltransferase
MPPDVRRVAPARRVCGRLRVPGDKSISHRYAILAALADGPSILSNFAPGADCRSTLSCLERLGVEVGGTAGADAADSGADTTPATVTVMGRGLGRLCSPAGPLDAGNSGTTMRLLAGVLAGHPFSATLVGDASLSRRPMRRVMTPLEQMGARIESAAGGRAPLTIHGTQLHAIAYRPDVPSAQIKSAVLLAGLLADGVTSVSEPAATRDHTERALAAFGGQAWTAGGTVSVAAHPRLTGRALAVPGDFSSAAFWLVAAAAMPGSVVEVEDVGLNPTRTALLDVLRRYGARVDVEPSDLAEGGEPRGRIVVAHERSGSVTIEPDEVPRLIDEIPAIAALAAHGGEVAVTGAAELRVKESDRIATLVAGFSAMGLDAEERPDGFAVAGAGGMAPGGAADARGDHRMAMAFAIAALAARQPSTIAGADSVAISYPGFFETLDRLASHSGGAR